MVAIARPRPSIDRSRLRPSAVGLAGSLLLAFGLLLAAGSASALEDLSPGSVPATAAGSCPALTQIKYPWITCQGNEYGGVSLSVPSEPAPLACHLRLRDGACAASPEEWIFQIPVLNPTPSF